MKPYSIFLSVVLVVCIGLISGCKPSSTAAPKPADKSSATEKAAASAQEKKAPTKEQLAEKKLAAYADVYNMLVDDDEGLPEAYRTFVKKVVKARVPSNMRFPAMKDFEKSLDMLRQVRAEATDGQGTLDAAADELILAGEKVFEQEKEATPYLRGRISKKDQSKSRAAFAELDEKYKSTLSKLSVFGAEIMKGKRALAEKHMAQLRQAGDMVRYHTEEMLLLSEELLALFDDPKVPFNRADAFTKGNELVAKLQEVARAQQKAVADAGKAQAGKVSAYYDAVRSGMEGIVADYREVRDRKSQTAFAEMLKKYDKAVADYNSTQVKS